MSAPQERGSRPTGRIHPNAKQCRRKPATLGANSGILCRTVDLPLPLQLPCRPADQSTIMDQADMRPSLERMHYALGTAV